MSNMDFFNQIISEAKLLIDPVITVIKGILNIMAQIFTWLADLIKNIHS